MNTKNSIGSLVAGALSVVAIVLSLYAVTHLGGTAKQTAAFGATGFTQGEVYYNPYIFVNGFSAGSAQNFLVDGTGAVSIGVNGTPLHAFNFGTCVAWSGSNTIAASSTATIDCGGGAFGKTALTGITAGEVADIIQGTTTPSTFEGIEVRGASASSTPGYITMLIYNGTGATFTWTATASSSFSYQVNN